MATRKQKLAADRIIENHGNVSKSMREAGYSEASAKNPSNLLDSKGFMELMDEKGLTDSLIIEALVEDINGKPKNRTGELALAIKMRGRITDKTDLTSMGEKLGVVLNAEQSEQLIRARAGRSDT